MLRKAIDNDMGVEHFELDNKATHKVRQRLLLSCGLLGLGFDRPFCQYALVASKPWADSRCLSIDQLKVVVNNDVEEGV
jgi:hypothetical protein